VIHSMIIHRQTTHTHTNACILSQALARVLYGVLVSVSLIVALPPLVIVVAQERHTVIVTAV